MAWMRSGVRSPSAPQTEDAASRKARRLLILVFEALAALALLGCNSEARDPSKDAKADAGAPTSGTSTSGATAEPTSVASGGPTGPAASCTSDADCRTFASYCAESPCGCRAIGKSEADPKCAGAQVSCFADPCMKKAAACQSGRCELVVAPSR